MNREEFENWQKGVKEHLFKVNNMVEERVLLKKYLESHLRQFFDFEEIEFSRDFKKVDLIWHDETPTIKYENIRNFMMDWKVVTYFDDVTVIVEVYPFGVE